jgi:hypothetical protein
MVGYNTNWSEVWLKTTVAGHLTALQRFRNRSLSLSLEVEGHYKSRDLALGYLIGPEFNFTIWWLADTVTPIKVHLYMLVFHCTRLIKA